MADDDLVLHLKACRCRRHTMNGIDELSHQIAKRVVPRDEWIRLRRPANIESYLERKQAEAPPPTEPAPDMVQLRGSTRAGLGAAGRAATTLVPRAEWVRLGRPGTTNSYREALENEKKGPPAPDPENDVVELRGSAKLGGAAALKAVLRVPRADWKRLGRPSTSNAYQEALRREKAAGKTP